MRKVLIITGPAGDAQGWGDLSVTENVCQAIKDTGNDAEIAFVTSMAEFYRAIEEKRLISSGVPSTISRPSPKPSASATATTTGWPILWTRRKFLTSVPMPRP